MALILTSALYPFVSIQLSLVAMFVGLAGGITYQSLQNEGDACLEMAAAIPGLKSLTRK